MEIKSYMNKDKECHYDSDCKNKFFRMDRISPTKEIPMCRKHWYMCNYGLSEYEASKK